MLSSIHVLGTDSYSRLWTRDVCDKGHFSNGRRWLRRTVKLISAVTPVTLLPKLPLSAQMRCQIKSEDESCHPMIIGVA